MQGGSETAAFDVGPLRGSRAIMPVLLKEGLARVENAREKKFQVKRQIGVDLRIRVYCIKAGILDGSADNTHNNKSEQFRSVR